MSWDALTWALTQKRKAPEKLVLLLLAYRVNPDTDVAEPTIDKLATECGMSRSGLKQVLQRLVDADLIAVEIRKADDGKNLPNRYRLSYADARGHDVTPTAEGPRRDRGRGHDVTTKAKPSSKEFSIAGAGLDFSSWPSKPSEPVLVAWLAHRKKKHADNSELAMTRMGNELQGAIAKGWTVDDAITEQIFRNWTGLKAEWLDEKTPPGRAGSGFGTQRGSGNYAQSGQGGKGGDRRSAIERTLDNAASRRSEAEAIAGDGAGLDFGGDGFQLRE